MTTQTACAPFGPAPENIGQTFDDPVVIGLVASARDGDAQAWDALVVASGYDCVTRPLSAGNSLAEVTGNFRYGKGLGAEC